MSEKEEVYCICRSSDIDRFMIMCDKCAEWFHGNCIRVSEKESRHIKYFYCEGCRRKDPTLKIKYRKTKRRELEAKEKKMKQKIKSKKMHSSHAESRSSKHSEKREKDQSKMSKKEGGINKMSSINHKKTKDSSLASNSSQNKMKNRLKISDDDNDDDDIDFLPPTFNSKSFSIPKVKHNNNNNEGKTKEKAAPSVVTTTMGTETNSFKEKKHMSSNSKPSNTMSSVTTTTVSSRMIGGCGDCDNCVRKHDCGVCDVCHDRETGAGANRHLCCRLRRCLNHNQPQLSAPTSKKVSAKVKSSTTTTHTAVKRPAPDSETAPAPVEVKTSKISLTTTTGNNSNNATSKAKKKKKKEVKLVALPPPTLVNNSNVKYSDVQCVGPRCVEAARVGSKYCSVACGRALARARIVRLMPGRVRHCRTTPTVADEMGREDLARLRASMVDEKKELERLEGKFARLEKLIAAAKQQCVSQSDEGDDDLYGDVDQAILCVICGQSCSVRNATKHMDRCYNKTEALTSFGSVYATRIEGSQRLFCDFYDEQQQTYCKRLQVLCPEHTKEPKVSESEVCGCPVDCGDIFSPDFSLSQAKFCRQPKKKCNRHYKWETMYRAEVDLQRIRQWLKIDEIFDEERKIRTAMSNRLGVMSLLLHETTAHDPTCVDMRTKPTVTKKRAYKLMI